MNNTIVWVTPDDIRQAKEYLKQNPGLGYNNGRTVREIIRPELKVFGVPGTLEFGRNRLMWMFTLSISSVSYIYLFYYANDNYTFLFLK